MRHPARHGKADSNQAPIKEAIELLIWPLPVMVLSAAGNGVEDLLVPIPRARMCCVAGLRMHEMRADIWLLVECKVPRNKRGEATASQYTAAQREWREKTAAWPRITVTSAQDAVDQIREMTR